MSTPTGDVSRLVPDYDPKEHYRVNFVTFFVKKDDLHSIFEEVCVFVKYSQFTAHYWIAKYNKYAFVYERNCKKHLCNNNLEYLYISFCIFFTAESVQTTVLGVPYSTLELEFSFPDCTTTKISFMSSFSGNCAGPNFGFHIHVSVSDLYIPRIGPHISCSRIGRPIVWIHKSLTDTWCGNWDWGRAIPRKGIHKSGFRCSAIWERELKLDKVSYTFLGIFVSNFRNWFFVVRMRS